MNKKIGGMTLENQSRNSGIEKKRKRKGGPNKGSIIGSR